MIISCHRGWAIVLMTICGLGAHARADLIAYWNFNSGYSGAPGDQWPGPISPDIGSGLIDMAGWHGPTNTFAGTTINALVDDPAGTSLALEAGGLVDGAFPGNGGYVQIDFSTLQRKDLVVSFATRGVNNGFTSGFWWWSIDGEDYQVLPGVNTATTSTTYALRQVDFAGVTVLNNQPMVSLRYQLSGATTSLGTIRIDNLQLNARLDPATPLEHVWAFDRDGLWSDGENWTAGVPSGAGTHVHLGDAITEDRTISVDVPHTVGTLTFDHLRQYTIAGPAALSLDDPAGDARVSVIQGSHTISAELMLAADTVIEAGPGSKLTLSNLGPSAVTIDKRGPGALQVNNVRGGSLDISDGVVQVLPNGTASGAGEIASLSIAPGAALDLTNNSLLISNGDIGTIGDLVRSGRTEAGDWTGSGIVSSAAAAETGRELGIMPDGEGVRVRFTWAGDANLDGAVGIADLSILAANWQQGDRGWWQGDFNYDGTVDISDLSMLAANWQKGAADPAGMSFAEALAMFDTFDKPGAGAIDGSAVPEPSGAGVMIVCMYRLLGGRRRR